MQHNWTVNSFSVIFNQAAAGVYNQYHTLQCASQISINLEVYDSKPSGRKSQSSHSLRAHLQCAVPVILSAAMPDSGLKNRIVTVPPGCGWLSGTGSPGLSERNGRRKSSLSLLPAPPPHPSGGFWYWSQWHVVFQWVVLSVCQNALIYFN